MTITRSSLPSENALSTAVLCHSWHYYDSSKTLFTGTCCTHYIVRVRHGQIAIILQVHQRTAFNSPPYRRYGTHLPLLAAATLCASLASSSSCHPLPIPHQPQPPAPQVEGIGVPDARNDEPPMVPMRGPLPPAVPRKPLPPPPPPAPPLVLPEDEEFSPWTRVPDDADLAANSST